MARTGESPSPASQLPMGAILDFYRGRGANGSGYQVSEILAWPDSELEDVHDYIQWLFPLPEPSGANPRAPVLDRATIEAFRSEEELRSTLSAALERMLAFYGFAWQGEDLVPGPRFAVHASNWMHPGNHNHLRLTRMIRSLRILGLEQKAQALWRALNALYAADKTKARITSRTYDYWRHAATEDL